MENQALSAIECQRKDPGTSSLQIRLIRRRNPLPMAVVMGEWLCRKKGVRLMRNGKIQEAVTCDLLLQVSHSMGTEIPISSVEGCHQGDVGSGYKRDE